MQQTGRRCGCFPGKRWGVRGIVGRRWQEKGESLEKWGGREEQCSGRGRQNDGGLTLAKGRCMVKDQLMGETPTKSQQSKSAQERALIPLKQ